MDFNEYLDLIKMKLKNADEREYLRLVILLRDTCNDTIVKIERHLAEEPNK